MDYRQIEYFICLYEEGSVTRAAQRLHIVQPALSMQIAKLEQALGRQLFVRSSKGMAPTEHGTQTYRLFLPILAQFADAEAQLLGTKTDLTGHARIGLPGSLAQDVLADAVADFSDRHPGVTVSVTEAYTDALVEGVKSGQLDAAIVNQPSRSMLRIEPVFQEEFVVIAGPLHPILPASMPLRKVSTLRLVLPTPQHGLRRILEGFAEKANVQLPCSLEMDSLQAIAQLVERSRFVSIVPASAVRSRLAQGRLRGHSVTRPTLVRQLCCVTHPRRPLAPPAAALLEVLLRYVRDREGLRQHPEV